jgi:cytochrome c oxidase subunit 5a
MRRALIASSSVLRARSLPLAARAAPLAFVRHASHGQESFEQFTSRYVSFFQSVQDLFELQRGLNNCFAHDLVPAPTVVEAALRAARRVNDYSTAVRIFEGVREKVENKSQYSSYLEELKPVREELGESLCSCFRVCVSRGADIGDPFSRHLHKRGTLLVIKLWLMAGSS